MPFLNMFRKVMDKKISLYLLGETLISIRYVTVFFSGPRGGSYWWSWVVTYCTGKARYTKVNKLEKYNYCIKGCVTVDILVEWREFPTCFKNWRKLPISMWKWNGSLPVGVWNLFTYLLAITCNYCFAVPLVSRMSPSDTYKVYKKGPSVRIDTTLLGFDHTRWQRGNRSYIFQGESRYSSRNSNDNQK